MYEKFTDRARKVMQLANQAAQKLNHEYVGTEHILLGLLRLEEGIAIRVLTNLGIELRCVETEIMKFVVPNPDMVTMGKLPLTPRSQLVIKHAIEESRDLGHDYISTEHLLLGLLLCSEGIAVQVLSNFGVAIKEVREQISKFDYKNKSGIQIIGDLKFSDKPSDLSEDMLEVQLPNGVLVHAGWYPESSPTGCYRITVNKNGEVAFYSETFYIWKAREIVEKLTRLCMSCN